MNYQKAIRDFIVSNFLYGEPGSLRDDTSFLDSGTIDSTGVLELVLFLEQTFRIKVLEEEMVPENLDTIDRLVRFVASKLPEPRAVRAGGSDGH